VEQGDAELMAKEQVLGFKPAPRLEQVSDLGKSSVSDMCPTDQWRRSDNGASGGGEEGAAKTPLTLNPSQPALFKIHHDPDDAAYVAIDAKSGLSILRHQDRARLRAMCDRIGWQVEPPKTMPDSR